MSRDPKEEETVPISSHGVDNDEEENDWHVTHFAKPYDLGDGDAIDNAFVWADHNKQLLESLGFDSMDQYLVVNTQSRQIVGWVDRNGGMQGLDEYEELIWTEMVKVTGSFAVDIESDHELDKKSTKE